MDEDAPFKQKMHEIGDRYLRRTFSELDRLQDALERARNGDAARFVDIGQIAHKVHGSGAMFGFHAVSDAAGELERCVDAHLNGPGAGDEAAFLARCGELIEQLRAETHQAARSRGLL